MHPNFKKWLANFLSGRQAFTENNGKPPTTRHYTNGVPKASCSHPHFFTSTCTTSLLPQTQTRTSCHKPSSTLLSCRACRDWKVWVRARSHVGLRLCSVLLWKVCRSIMCMLVCLRGNWQVIFNLGCMSVLRIFRINIWCGTVSKALLMSMAAISALGVPPCYLHCRRIQKNYGSDAALHICQTNSHLPWSELIIDWKNITLKCWALFDGSSIPV